MTANTSINRNDAGIKTVCGILTQRFGDRLNTRLSVCEHHGHTTTWIANQPPDAVISPRKTEEVSAIVSICADHAVPVIPFGTGTSLEGQVNAPRGGICIDFSEMDRVLAVNQDDLDCIVEPRRYAKSAKCSSPGQRPVFSNRSRCGRQFGRNGIYARFRNERCPLRNHEG